MGSNPKGYHKRLQRYFRRGQFLGPGKTSLASSPTLSAGIPEPSADITDLATGIAEFSACIPKFSADIADHAASLPELSASVFELSADREKHNDRGLRQHADRG